MTPQNEKGAVLADSALRYLAGTEAYFSFVASWPTAASINGSDLAPLIR